MSERMDQAYEEAMRRYPDKHKSNLDPNLRAAFMTGTVWADSNPHSTPEALAQAYEGGQRDAVSKGLARVRVTRAQVREAQLNAAPGSGAAGVLRELGIEVTDGE